MVVFFYLVVIGEICLLCVYGILIKLNYVECLCDYVVFVDSIISFLNMIINKFDVFI